MAQIVVAREVAVAVDQEHHVTLGFSNGNIAGCAGEPSRIGEQANVGVPLGKTGHQRRRAVVRLAVDNDDLEAIAVVILVNQLREGPLDEPRLVPHGHDDADEERRDNRIRAGGLQGSERGKGGGPSS